MTTPGIPKTMKALQLIKHIPDYKALSAEELQKHFEVKEIEVPKPKSGQVLVKVARSPINPSDLSTLKGSYDSAARSQLPWTPGFEGSGTVVANGGGMMGWNLQGKRVGLVVGATGGMWAEYIVAPATTCLPLPDEIDFDTGSSCFVNPLTVLSFVEIAHAGGHTAMVHTAAGSALGKMLIRVCAAEKIKVIGIVRRPEQVDELLKLGATAVFCTADTKGKDAVKEEEGEAEKDKSWEAQFKDKCKQLRCRLAFDAVGGELTGKLLHAMPNRSTVYVYGGLSEEPCTAYIGDLIFQGKTVTGFWVTEYVKSKGFLAKMMSGMKVRKLLGNELKTQIRDVMGMERVGEAIAAYVSDMSAGKILITPTEVTKEEGKKEVAKEEKGEGSSTASTKEEKKEGEKSQ